MKETLKALREQFNYSQNTVANFLGISRQMYIKYENGEVEPSVKTIVALCGLYKVPYDYIIENKGNIYVENNLEHKKVSYNDHNQTESKTLVLADSGANTVSNYNIDQNYSQTVVNMFSKLSFIKQLSVFAELAGIIQKQSEEEAEMKLETKKEMSPLDRFLDRANKHPGNSNGWKWNREELYER